MEMNAALLEAYFDRLFPLNRSLTGNGVRQSMAIMQEIMPLQLHEIESGTQVYDWTIPNEWNVEDAYIITPNGNKIAQFKEHNLHLLGYSIPVEAEVDFDTLNEHLHYLIEMPAVIPYVTSYYKERWGFCISYNEYLKLPRAGKYKVVVKSTLQPGALTYADLLLEGETKEEILFTSYLCHPSMANNELSGPLCLAALYHKLKEMPSRKYSYRFVIAPETIGTIAYLHKYGAHYKQYLKAGYVVSCVGLNTHFTYKRTKLQTAETDLIAEHILRKHSASPQFIDFFPKGSDERQYAAPGFNLPVGSMVKGMYYQYAEYHTSADNKELISFEAILETADIYSKIAMAFELNACYINNMPFGEPQLGKRGLYPNLSTKAQSQLVMDQILYLLSYGDGKTNLLTIAEKANISILEFKTALEQLTQAGLLSKI
jgi:aminopeptidase-like protein